MLMDRRIRYIGDPMLFGGVSPGRYSDVNNKYKYKRLAYTKQRRILFQKVPMMTYLRATVAVTRLRFSFHIVYSCLSV